jgi:hypothetical protein
MLIYHNLKDKEMHKYTGVMQGMYVPEVPCSGRSFYKKTVQFKRCFIGNLGVDVVY